MAEANEAYQKGDIETLQLILEESAYLIDGTETSYLELKISRIKQKIFSVEKRISQIEKEIIELKASNLYKLMINVQVAFKKGIDLLQNMADEIESSIIDRQKTLDNLLKQYNQRNRGNRESASNY